MQEHSTALALAIVLSDVSTLVALIMAVAALIGAVAKSLDTYLNFKSRRKK